MGKISMNANCRNSTYQTRRGYRGGVAPASVAFQASRERELLARTIAALPELAEERGYKAVSDKTISSALAIAQCLPENRALPKVAVDEDGDILMVWGEPSQKFALTIEGETLHMVVNPGQHSTHLDPVIYYGGYLSLPVLQNVPKR